MFELEENKIFEVNNLTFHSLAIEVFQYQYHQNSVYKAFVDALQIKAHTIDHYLKIPFLPVQFFKHLKICTTTFIPEAIFTSSGTTGVTTSSHHIKKLELYKKSYLNTFQQFYGNVQQYCILGLLPSYLEREGSSLVYMVADLIDKSNHPLSDFYLYEHEHLYLILQELEKDKQPTILFGVTFALLDFAAKYTMHLEHVTIIETGGMKGRGKEITREQLHLFLKTKLGVQVVHSEYGMTEMLSQAYSLGNGIYKGANWLKPLVRSEDDPLQVTQTGKGLLNIIDLVNLYSCSFLATDDITTIKEDASFEVLGRLDGSDLRGCSLLTV